MKEILLLEDDINLSETIEEYLAEEGFSVSCVYEGKSAEEMMYEKNFDLFVLDVNVPSPNGFELLKSARDSGDTTPAIYITSLNSTKDLSKGFDSGCDDYIRKPFSLEELLLRINNILKRNFYHNPNEVVKIDDKLSYDIKADELLEGESALPLNKKEKTLLKLFLQHPNEQISHEVIQEHLWEFEEEPSDTALRTYIKNLRKLIGKERIVSIKRYGYKYA